MRTENGGRTRCRNGLQQGAPDTPGFTAAWNRHNQLAYFENGRNCERHGLAGNVLELPKPSFGELLLPAFRIERDDLHGFRIVEIRFRWIIKGEVSVFPYSEQAKLWIRGT